MNPICTACGHQAEGHNIAHYYQQGGGMENQRLEWLILSEKEQECENNKGCSSAATSCCACSAIPSLCTLVAF
jgi:hypothetical protein